MFHKLSQQLRDPATFWIVIAAMAVLSIPMRLGGATPDVSWLIDMCERILNGEIAYIDIFETTPPAPTLLYMPGVMLSRILPISAEAANYLIAYGATVGALFLSDRILPASIDGIGLSRWLVIFPAALFLFLLSTDAFAQREYYSAAFALPIVSVFIRNLHDNQWPSYSLRAWAALLAGLSIAIKPPLFILPGVFLAAYYFVLTRKVRFVYSSGLGAAGLIGVALTAISLVMFPAYLDGVTTLMRDIYVVVREPWRFALKPAFIGTIGSLLFVLIVSISQKIPNSVWAVFSVAAAYVIVFAVQGKYFPYHLFPAALFAMITITIVFWKRLAGLLHSPKQDVIALSVYGIVTIWIIGQFAIAFDDHRPTMKDLSWASEFEQPTAMAITPYIGVGFPLARKINARWVDRIHSQWVINYAKFRLTQPALTESEVDLATQYFNNEIERVHDLISEKEPDLIIQSVAPAVNWLNAAMLENDPSYLDSYEVIAEEGVFRIWAHKDALMNPEQ